MGERFRDGTETERTATAMSIRTVPISWKVSHVKIAERRWGTDITLSCGRILKFTGKLSHIRAVEEASKILRMEAQTGVLMV